MVNLGNRVARSQKARLTCRKLRKLWLQMGQDIDGEAARDQSGISVSLSSDGKTVAIGAHYNDGVNGEDSGHVRVYKLTN